MRKDEHKTFEKRNNREILHLLEHPPQSAQSLRQVMRVLWNVWEMNSEGSARVEGEVCATEAHVES